MSKIALKKETKPRVRQEELFSEFESLRAHHRTELLARRLIRITAGEPPDIANAALSLAMRWPANKPPSTQSAPQNGA